MDPRRYPSYSNHRHTYREPVQVEWEDTPGIVAVWHIVKWWLGMALFAGLVIGLFLWQGW